MNNLFVDNEKRQRGAVLVTALVILAVLSLAGTASLNTATIEIEATGNVKMNKIAFYSANGGLEMTPRLIRRALVDDYSNPTTTPLITYDGDDDGSDAFYEELMGYIDDNNDSPINDPDIQMTMGECTVAVDVYRVPAGGGTVGQPGIVYGGSGGSGRGGAGTYIQYNFNALGTAPDGGSSIIGAEYLYRVQ